MKPWIGLLCTLERLRIRVTHGDQLTSLERIQVPDDVRTPVPESDNPNPHNVRGGVDGLWWHRKYCTRETCRGNDAAAHTDSCCVGGEKKFGNPDRSALVSAFA